MGYLTYLLVLEMSSHEKQRSRRSSLRISDFRDKTILKLYSQFDQVVLRRNPLIFSMILAATRHNLSKQILQGMQGTTIIIICNCFRWRMSSTIPAAKILNSLPRSFRDDCNVFIENDLIVVNGESTSRHSLIGDHDWFSHCEKIRKIVDVPCL